MIHELVEQNHFSRNNIFLPYIPTFLSWRNMVTKRTASMGMGCKKGLCVAHVAKKKRKLCSFKGCPKQVVKSREEFALPTAQCVNVAALWDVPHTPKKNLCN